MPDFTSALYLGLRHPSRALSSWAALSTGAPAALRPVAGAREAARALAALQGADAAVLMPSTLHIAWDLGELCDPASDVVEVDVRAYPILRVAASVAAARGVPVRPFAFGVRRRRRPIVITDGLVGGCPAPLGAIVESVRPCGGLVIVDDTQAIGLVGRGGGGSLRRHGAAEEVLIVTSLAKAFGVPVAALSGSAALVQEYTERSVARVHCSPPSVAAVRALARALGINERCGDRLRARLFTLIRRFRRGLRRLGLRAWGGGFPVQALPDDGTLHARLLAAGVRTVAQPGRVVFVLTARHSPADVDRALAVLARVVA